MSAYAIYTRQSRVRHDVTLSSCDVQFQICRDYADAVLPRGITWCETRYDAPDQSGENFDRPALKAMLAEIEKGTISHVIVYRLDRLSRRLRDTIQLLDSFQRHQVELKIVTAPMLGESASSQFMLNLLASFAEFEHSLISDRLQESIRARRRGGRRLSGKPPFGYDLDASTNGLMVNAGEARKVSEFFRLAADGQTPRQIAECATKRGWTTKANTSVATCGRPVKFSSCCAIRSMSDACAVKPAGDGPVTTRQSSSRNNSMKSSHVSMPAAPLQASARVLISPSKARCSAANADGS